ncbi:MAG: DUF4190 domain-containing protein [Candidatus Geothermincolia bacterium]
MQQEKGFCPFCGGAVPRGAGVCPHCGNALGAGTMPPASVPPTTPSYPGEPPYPAPGRTSGLAVASLVVAIFGFFVCYFIGPVTAIALGYMARQRLEDGPQTGEGLATAGILIGFAGLTLQLLLVLAALVGLLAWRPWSDVILLALG